MLVDEFRLLQATVKARCDPLRSVRIAREENDWSVIATLGVQVNLGHAASATTGPTRDGGHRSV